MASREYEYGWYLVGCQRTGQTPIDLEAFSAWWQEYEDHAERLKAAEAEKTLLEMDSERRAEMLKRMQSDPIVQAVMVGMSEDEQLK